MQKVRNENDNIGQIICLNFAWEMCQFRLSQTLVSSFRSSNNWKPGVSGRHSKGREIIVWLVYLWYLYAIVFFCQFNLTVKLQLLLYYNIWQYKCHKFLPLHWLTTNFSHNLDKFCLVKARPYLHSTMNCASKSVDQSINRIWFFLNVINPQDSQLK